MSQSALEVVKAGPLTLLQDSGRFGLAPFGITTGGPADEYAFSWANHLLENSPECATLEITLGPAVFIAQSDCHLALCGAQMNAKIDGTAVTNWSEFILKKGQCLSLSTARNGLRSYLAVRGGFAVKPQLNSVSCVTREHLGGMHHNGRPIASGETVAFHSHTLSRYRGRFVTFRFTPDYNLPLRLRVISGAQFAQFDKQAVAQFFQSEYHVSTDVNRMGYRLTGPAITPPSHRMQSEGIALGAIQIPTNGQPIVLLNDRQTIGGYPKLGYVARIDLPRLAQAKPGQLVSFVQGDRPGLQAVWCQWARFFGY
ncbi:biotin-dependent carboxyltransferase [Vibrio sp. SM6]|uniref:Biotin-dependent carboxyltransferase n=1 Tax=Vibrio agarilyticus TaxID=2726741 RepID=A0A7X8YGU1_9VIBR|nr:biotin-dependent carboxyltransferase family protein [Vibrio agarilyticus]NLS13388.1 biotin-dependent carboxyltransferase [Vibrio agarilyticus]